MEELQGQLHQTAERRGGDLVSQGPPEPEPLSLPQQENPEDV